MTASRTFLLRLCLALWVLPSLVYGEQFRNHRDATAPDSQIGQAGEFQLPVFYALRVLPTQDEPLYSAPDFPVLPALALSQLDPKALPIRILIATPRLAFDFPALALARAPPLA